MPAGDRDFPAKAAKGLTRCGASDWLIRPGIGYRLSFPSAHVQFDLTRIRRDDGASAGLLTVRTSIKGAYTIGDGIISSADFNCSVLRTRKERSNHLADRSQAAELDWFGALEELCLRVLEAEEAGTPEASLETVPIRDDQGVNLDAGGLPLVRRHPTMWFGDGGAGKSYLALYAAVALAQEGEKVLYCDWEFSGEDHRRRLNRLVGPVPALPELWYLRCERPLVREIDRLQAIVGKRNITALVCDSAGFAALGAPEAAEAALGYFGALRTLGPLTSLHLAHMNKGEQGDLKPFGSSYWFNGARSIWFLKRSEADEQDALSVGFYHRKSNTGKLQPTRGVRIEFVGSETRIMPTTLDDPELTAKMSLRERLTAQLKNGAVSTKECATLLGAAESSVRTTVARFPNKFIRLSDGRIGLSECATE